MDTRVLWAVWILCSSAACWAQHVATEDSLTVVLEAAADPEALLVDLEGDAVEPVRGLGSLQAELRHGRIRSQWAVARGDWSGRLDLRREEGAVRTGGAAVWRAGRCELVAGRFTLHLGHGLLQAGAGRRASLGAATPLPVGRSGWRARGAAVDPGDLSGVLLSARSGAVGVRAWRALRAGERSEGMDWEVEAPWRLGVSLVRAGSGLGAAVRCVRVGLSLQTEVEAAARREGAGAPWRGSATATARLGVRRFGVGFQAAQVEPGFAAPGGARPAVLCGADGSGWALRVHWRGSDRTWTGLLASGRARSWREDGPQETVVRRFELSGEGRAGATRWSARLARREEQDRNWQGQHAWAPSRLSAPSRDTRLSARVQGEVATLRWRLDWRTLLRERAMTDDRSLLAVRVDHSLDEVWSLRWGTTWAWGGGADLTGIEAPVRGWLLPRHWGAWRDAVSAGVAGVLADLRVSLGLALRRPIAGAPGDPDLAVRLTVAAGDPGL